jgi:hypothetical protein
MVSKEMLDMFFSFVSGETIELITSKMNNTSTFFGVDEGFDSGYIIMDFDNPLLWVFEMQTQVALLTIEV